MPELLKDLAVLAPAKINLHLAVKEKRSDGFHNIESVFLALDWGDSLFFECKAPETENDELIMLRAEQTGEPLSIPDNIILRALALFREKTGFFKKFKITVEKRIPVGGGLGGGSSDAAASLLALNRMAGLPLGKDALLEAGNILGSDIPFFLHEIPAAWVTGRGENIEPLEMPLLAAEFPAQMFLVLVNPGFSSNTAEAYRLLDEHRAKEKCFNNSPLYNDFLPVFDEREKSIYNKICFSLRGLGALFASLSGAGSTCFGVFQNREQAQKAAEELRGEWSFVHCCNSKI